MNRVTELAHITTTIFVAHFGGQLQTKGDLRERHVCHSFFVISSTAQNRSPSQLYSPVLLSFMLAPVVQAS